MDQNGRHKGVAGHADNAGQIASPVVDRREESHHEHDQQRVEAEIQIETGGWVDAHDHHPDGGDIQEDRRGQRMVETKQLMGFSGPRGVLIGTGRILKHLPESPAQLQRFGHREAKIGDPEQRQSQRGANEHGGCHDRAQHPRLAGDVPIAHEYEPSDRHRGDDVTDERNDQEHLHDRCYPRHA